MIIAGQETKNYIGDSVYADFDGYSVVLTTDNGYGPSNRIVMEPNVIVAFQNYLTRLQALCDHRCRVTQRTSLDQAGRRVG